MADTQSFKAAQRIDYLESIRGLAAVQVVLLHCFTAFAPALVFGMPATDGLAGYIHLSPLSFLYDGYSAVYIFFTLSGYVLSRSFARQVDHPFVAVLARAVRLGLPAIAATMIAALVLFIFGRPNAQAGLMLGSDWFVKQWDPDLSIVAVLRDGFANALVLGYRGFSNVAFLSPFQQPIEKSFVAPLWTLSIEFYGSVLVLGLCICAQRSQLVWRSAVLLGVLAFIRSPYICFFVGHVAAMLLPADRPAPARVALPTVAIGLGVVLCGVAEGWQPGWLVALCDNPMPFPFPGQTAAMQQKTYGAILVLAGLISLPAVCALLSRRWLVVWSQLSFPLYLVHWPILFGPAAALFLALNDSVGTEIARASAIIAALLLSFGASLLFLPIDRSALNLSRLMQRAGREWGRFGFLRRTEHAGG